MKSFTAFRLIRRKTNMDGIIAWAVSLEPLGEISSSCPETALRASRAKWPFIPRGDLLVGPGDQGPPPEH
jgi:hypothetical protein